MFGAVIWWQYFACKCSRWLLCNAIKVTSTAIPLKFCAHFPPKCLPFKCFFFLTKIKCYFFQNIVVDKTFLADIMSRLAFVALHPINSAASQPHQMHSPNFVAIQNMFCIFTSELWYLLKFTLHCCIISIVLYQIRACLPSLRHKQIFYSAEIFASCINRVSDCGNGLSNFGPSSIHADVL